MRYESQSALERFKNATLIRVNVEEPFNEREAHCPGRTIAVPLGGKAAMEAIEAALGE